ncbi:hypothetical protein [Streptomyces sp. NPDC005209]|uniref:hypothetical protein n=1 Tax=Streptomyces sp. NPDC005209 TaxID=3156715 RepID=UPI0033B584E2
MSENPETSEIPGTHEIIESGAAESAAESGVGKPVRTVRAGRRIAAVAGPLLLAGALLISGVGYTVLTVQDADRDPGRPTWRFPAAAEDDEKSAKDDTKSGSGLSALLLPFGTDDSKRGPDVQGFGADAELSGAQATAVRKESLKDLPGSTRRELEKLIDKQRIRGIAMRSYVFGRTAYNNRDVITIGVTVERLDNRTAVRRMATSFNAFLAATDVFRKGPKIEGHKDARCFLTPKGGDDDLGSAFCTAYVGNVLVSVTADAPDPVDGKFVAKFFAAQLDRIDDPGQAV